MVVPIENIVDKFLSSTLSSSTMPKLQALALPTVPSLNHTEMDISIGQVPTNDCEIRERTPTTTLNLSREFLIAFSGRAMPYCDRMDDRMDCESTSGDMTPELSYETEQEKALHTSKTVDQQDPMRPTSGNNEASPTHTHHEESIINIQLPYSPHAPMELDLWSRSFHLISLYGLIEHFASDSKSIKDSLNFMMKYITNKQINSKKVNDLKDFDGMSNAIWNLSYWYMRLNGTPSTWTITLTLLERKYLPNSLQELCLTRTTTRRKLPNWSLSPLRKSLLLLLHSQLNPRPKST